LSSLVLEICHSQINEDAWQMHPTVRRLKEIRRPNSRITDASYQDVITFLCAINIVSYYKFFFFYYSQYIYHIHHAL